MKKVVKLLTGIGVAIVGSKAYHHYLEKKKHDVCQTALANAKSKISNEEHVVGTWINMSSEQSHVYGETVYTGGITTDVHTYDFVADASTGRILSLEQQIRL